MNIIKNLKKVKLVLLILSFLVLFFYTLANIYLIYNLLLLNNIENLFRYLIIIILIIINFLFIIFSISFLIKRKKKIFILIILMIFFGLSFIILSFTINKIYGTIASLNKSYLNYATSIITLSDSNISDINDLNNKKIGMINDTTSIEGYIISMDIINENKLSDNNEIVEYNDFISILKDLYGKKIDAAFLSSNYIIMYKNISGFENLEIETKVIYTKSKKYENNFKNTKEKNLDKPFTLLIMGVDGTGETLDTNMAFNGDSLLLLTFNPNTLNATILSIPRDTYVPIACFKNQYENKITHAAWQGESCMIDTIENWTAIEIDYYVKINFKGLVNLVDSLGGIEVEVPYSFCEQDSNRQWGNNTIYVEKGYQTLNGEQALALARNRHPNPEMCSSKWTNYVSSDIKRGENQQLIIKAILAKFKDVNSFDQIQVILDTINKSIDTNISVNSILSFYNVGKDILTNNNKIINIEELYLSGYEQYIYDENMGTTLYNYIYYRGSLEDIVNAMKINLEIENPNLIKEFSFSINEEYEKKRIGEGTYEIVDYIETVPNFIGKTKIDALSWANEKGIKIIYIEEETNENPTGTIIDQNYPFGYRTKKLPNNTLTITIAKSKSTIPVTYIDCSKNENKEKEECLLPDFTDKTLEYFHNWAKNLTKYKVYLSIDKEEIDKNDPLYNANKTGLIIEQSKEKGTYLNDIVRLKIRYIEKED